MLYKKDYKNYKKITVEPVSNSKAVILGIILIIMVIFVNKSDLSKDVNYQDIYPYIYYGFLILSRVISLPLIYNMSKKIGKDPILYCILGLISPSIILILLGVSDIRLESKVAMKIVKKKRSEYRNEVYSLKQNNSDSDKLNEKLEKIKCIKNEELIKDLTEYYK